MKGTMTEENAEKSFEQKLSEEFDKDPVVVKVEKISTTPQTPAQKFASELDNPKAFTTRQVIYRQGDGNIIRHPEWGTNFKKNEDFDPTHVDKWNANNPIPDGVKWVPDRPAEESLQKMECDPAFVKALSGATSFFVDMVYKGVKKRLLDDPDFMTFIGNEIEDQVENAEISDHQVDGAVEAYLDNADLPDEDTMREIAEEVFNDSIENVTAELNDMELEVTVKNADISITRW